MNLEGGEDFALWGTKRGGLHREMGLQSPALLSQ